MSESAPCMWMRGGSSKGGYFLERDLPSDPEVRNRFLLKMMGSPDSRQIDGMGGADPLTSKVAIVKKSERQDVDVDYLFLQVFVDQAIVTDSQNCGNILAGVGAFAIERGLVATEEGTTPVTVYMENTGQLAKQIIQTPNGLVSYQGDTEIDGVPGSAAAVAIMFQNTAGSSCGALFPTQSTIDCIDGVNVTCIDNGMPVVLIKAVDLNIFGSESREELDCNKVLKSKLESIRLKIGPKMNLGDVKDKSVPKMVLVSEAMAGGTISTRSFIPHRCHASIGVLGAVSVATACVIKGTVAESITENVSDIEIPLNIEHPSGKSQVKLKKTGKECDLSAAVISSTRKLFDGSVFAN